MIDRQAAIDLLHGLVAIPSVSHKEGEASTWLVEQMRALGYERAFVDEAGNAVGELGDPKARRTILLLGHIDTVPGSIPVRIADSPNGEALYGRGSVDAKGPLAAFVIASAMFGAQRAKAARVKIVVAGAVEEEAATSKGARFIAGRLDGTVEDPPDACIIGEPSHWNRITLGYKGRLLLDLKASQTTSHTAGPDPSVAAVVVELWNRMVAQAAALNQGRDKAFEQLTPSLRRFVTSTTEDMHDRVAAQVAWRLPPEFDINTVVTELLTSSATLIGCEDAKLGLPQIETLRAIGGEPITLIGRKTSLELRFRGWEVPWSADRNNALVRSFQAAIRAEVAATRPAFVYKTGTSDMNVVAPIWRCPIVAYGPGDSTLDHTPDEHLVLDDYWKAIRVLARVLVTFAAS